jgi:hypothetical protein
MKVLLVAINSRAYERILNQTIVATCSLKRLSDAEIFNLIFDRTYCPEKDLKKEIR